MKTICAAEVTLEHQLIMPGRTIGLEKLYTLNVLVFIHRLQLVATYL